jgi:hypothetical protein
MRRLRESALKDHTGAGGMPWDEGKLDIEELRDVY